MRLFAAGIVLLAETETHPQILKDILQVWCDEKEMRVNLDKTKVVHFRSPSTLYQMYRFSLAMRTSGLQINTLNLV